MWSLGVELEVAVLERLRELGFDASPVPGAGEAGDLVITHPAVAGPLQVTVKTHVRRALTSAPPVPPAQSARHVLGVPSVTPAQAAAIKAAGLNYVDAAGNAWISADGLHIQVEGRPANDLVRAAHRQESRGWSARPTGLQVLFALLMTPELLDARLVDIAHVAGTSVATAHRSIVDLTDQGLLGGHDGSRIWVDRREAASTWMDGYLRRVLPRIVERPYLAPDVSPGKWLSLAHQTGDAIWVTGGAALEGAGEGLHVPSATIYGARSSGGRPAGVRIARAGREEPTLLVREPWWPDDAYDVGAAPALLVYADCLGSGDPRIAASAREVMTNDPVVGDLLAPQ